MFKKNQKKRAFFAAIAMLVLSAIVITTASFAWFTLGRNAMASDLDLKVTKQGEGIQISANASSFTDEITFEELNGTATSEFVAPSEEFNYFPATISPTSTNMALGSALPAFFTGGIDRATRIMESSAATSADGTSIYGKADVEIPAEGSVAGFYAFDVFVEYTSDAPDKEAKVKVTNTTIEVKNDETDGTTAIAEAANAMRIGFVNCGTVTKGSTPTAATSGSEAVIFATNAEARDTNPIISAGESAAVPDDAYVVPESAAGTLTIADGYDCGIDTGSEDVVLTLKSGVNQIRVYVWMEGQDANCTDSLMSQLISANLVFSLV